MTVTCWGPLADELGHTEWVETIAHEAPGGRLIAEERHTYGVLTAAQFRHRQPSSISVDIGHSGHAAGQVVYLEQGERYLQAVAVLDRLETGDLDAYGPMKFSTYTLHPRSDAVELESVALVKAANAATVGLPVLEYLPVDVRHGSSTLCTLPRNEVPDILRRAHEYDSERRWRDPMVIRQADLLSSIEYAQAPDGWNRLALRADGELIGLMPPPPLPDLDDRKPLGLGPMRPAGARGRVLAVH